MIASHNTFTYLSAMKWWMRPFNFIWRCQNKDIKQQKETGVKYLDIRIRFTKNHFRLCHGLVDLGTYKFDNIISVFNFCESFKCKYRLIIERGDTSWVTNSLLRFINNETSCDYFCIKKDWKVLFSRMNMELKDYSYVPIHTGNDCKKYDFKFTTIKKWAKEHNPVINKEMIEDDNILYYMDYV